MSHKLQLNAYNASDYEILEYSITHEWDGNITQLDGKNLKQGQSSMSKEITTGYTDYDNWIVSVIFDRPEHADQIVRFYCNSSQSDTTATIRIKNHVLDCEYNVTSPCSNKHFSDH